MKPSKFKTLSFIISLTGAFSIIFLGFPLWTFVLFVPALLYTQLLVSNHYTFRETILLEPIPDTGYENRIRDLETNQPFLSQLGFVKFDEFYMQTSNDLIAFAYQHKIRPIIALEYHLERLRTIDFNTKFQDEISVTTTNLKTAHLIERSDKKLFQNFPELSFEQLFQKHLQAIEFLREQGLEPVENDPKLFRQRLLQNFLEVGEKYKSLLAPITMLYRFGFGNKYEYNKTIQEQFLARSFQLPTEIIGQKSHLWRQ